MKHTSSLLLILFCWHFSQGQGKEKRSCNCAFQSLMQVGLLEGETGSAFHVQVTNGVQYRTWFMGLGTGLDYYRFRSIPLFIDIRKDILKKNLTPFVYADIGMHFPWKREGDSYYWNANLSTGLFYDMGLGLNVATRKNQGFSLSVGYSYKHVKESSTGSMVCITYPCHQYMQTRNYRLNRLSMKLGWRIRSD